MQQPQRAALRFTLVGMIGILRVHRQQFFPGIAEQFTHFVVNAQVTAIQSDVRDGDRRVVECGAHALFVLAQMVFVHLARGDIVGNRRRADNVSGAVADD